MGKLIQSSNYALQKRRQDLQRNEPRHRPAWIRRRQRPPSQESPRLRSRRTDRLLHRLQNCQWRVPRQEPENHSPPPRPPLLGTGPQGCPGREAPVWSVPISSRITVRFSLMSVRPSTTTPLVTSSPLLSETPLTPTPSSARATLPIFPLPTSPP